MERDLILLENLMRRATRKPHINCLRYDYPNIVQTLVMNPKTLEVTLMIPIIKSGGEKEGARRMIVKPKWRR